jgi:hypothetical protein
MLGSKLVTIKEQLQKWFLDVEGPQTKAEWNSMNNEQKLQLFEEQYKLLRETIHKEIEKLKPGIPQWKDLPAKVQDNI